MDISVEKFQESDRGAVRDICFRTGFLGETLEGILDNRDLFLDLSTEYFIGPGAEGAFTARGGHPFTGAMEIMTYTTWSSAKGYSRKKR